MARRKREAIGAGAERTLSELAASERSNQPASTRKHDPQRQAILAALAAADLIVIGPHGPELTAAGHAHLARGRLLRAHSPIDPYLGQHLAIAQRQIGGPAGPVNVTVDDAESPLAWLARRKGRDGRAMIDANQLQAGEKLRLAFTRAQLMPRVTSNWQAAVASGARGAAGGKAAHVTDVIVGARQSFRQALDAVGPEFAGLLVDVCCFLKGLEDCERERNWPARSAKVVLQLGLDRLARHYGLGVVRQSAGRSAMRTWSAPDAAAPPEQG